MRTIPGDSQRSPAIFSDCAADRLFYFAVMVSIVFILLGAEAPGDTIRFKHGGTMEGTIVNEDADGVTLRASGTEMTISRDEIASIERDETMPSAVVEETQPLTQAEADEIIARVAETLDEAAGQKPEDADRATVMGAIFEAEEKWLARARRLGASNGGLSAEEERLKNWVTQEGEDTPLGRGIQMARSMLRLVAADRALDDYDYEQAEAQLDAAKKLFPFGLQARLAAARLALRRGRLDRVVDELGPVSQEAPAVFHARHEASLLLAEALLERGDALLATAVLNGVQNSPRGEEAVSDWIARGRRNDVAYAYVRTAAFFVEQQDGDNARLALQKAEDAIGGASPSDELARGFAVVHSALGQNERARHWAEQAGLTGSKGAAPRNTGQTRPESQFAEATQRARREGKRLLLYLEDPNCPECVRFEREILDALGVRMELGKRYVVVRLDATDPEGQLFAKQLKAQRFPAVYVMSPEGAVIGAMMGTMPTTEAEMLRWLESR